MSDFTATSGNPSLRGPDGLFDQLRLHKEARQREQAEAAKEQQDVLSAALARIDPGTQSFLRALSPDASLLQRACAMVQVRGSSLGQQISCSRTLGTPGWSPISASGKFRALCFVGTPTAGDGRYSTGNLQLVVDCNSLFGPLHPILSVSLDSSAEPTTEPLTSFGKHGLLVRTIGDKRSTRRAVSVVLPKPLFIRAAGNATNRFEFQQTRYYGRDPAPKQAAGSVQRAEVADGGRKAFEALGSAVLLLPSWLPAMAGNNAEALDNLTLNDLQVGERNCHVAERINDRMLSASLPAFFSGGAFVLDRLRFSQVQEAKENRDGSLVRLDYYRLEAAKRAQLQLERGTVTSLSPDLRANIDVDYHPRTEQAALIRLGAVEGQVTIPAGRKFAFEEDVAAAKATSASFGATIKKLGDGNLWAAAAPAQELQLVEEVLQGARQTIRHAVGSTAVLQDNEEGPQVDLKRSWYWTFRAYLNLFRQRLQRLLPAFSWQDETNYSVQSFGRRPTKNGSVPPRTKPGHPAMGHASTEQVATGELPAANIDKFVMKVARKLTKETGLSQQATFAGRLASEWTMSGGPVSQLDDSLDFKDLLPKLQVNLSFAFRPTFAADRQLGAAQWQDIQGVVDKLFADSANVAHDVLGGTSAQVLNAPSAEQTRALGVTLASERTFGFSYATVDLADHEDKVAVRRRRYRGLRKSLLLRIRAMEAAKASTDRFGISRAALVALYDAFALAGGRSAGIAAAIELFLKGADETCDAAAAQPFFAGCGTLLPNDLKKTLLANASLYSLLREGGVALKVAEAESYSSYYAQQAQAAKLFALQDLTRSPAALPHRSASGERAESVGVSAQPPAVPYEVALRDFAYQWPAANERIRRLNERSVDLQHCRATTLPQDVLHKRAKRPDNVEPAEKELQGAIGALQSAAAAKELKGQVAIVALAAARRGHLQGRPRS